MKGPTHIEATCLQIRRAYERLYGTRIPGDIAYSHLAHKMIAELGFDNARALIEGEANDPDAPEPLVKEQP